MFKLRRKRTNKKSLLVRYLTKFDKVDLTKYNDVEYQHYKRAYTLEAYIRIIVGLVLTLGSLTVFLLVAYFKGF